MENRLPLGWEEISLEEIASYVIGGDWGKDSQEVDHEKIFVLRGTDYKNWDKVRAKNAAIRYFKKQSIEKRRLIEGDIILEVSGGGPDQPVGRVVSIDRKALESVDGKLSFSNFFRLIRIDKNINPYFVKAYLDYAYSRGDFNDMQTHTTNLRNLRVNEFLSKTVVPIPPHSEQQRIVAKLDELMKKIYSSRARLERIPEILKRFRQSILSAAVSGKLTAEWREKNRVTGEWQVKELKDVIIDKPKNGFSAKPVKYKTEFRVLTLSATTSGRFIPEHFKYFEEPIESDSQFWLQPNDILVQRGNTLEYVGVPAVYDGQPNQFIYPDLMMRLRVNDLITTKYLYYFLSTESTRNYLRDRATGTSGNMPKINQPTLMGVPINLPDLSEQNEIVRRVEKYFLLSDKIETRYCNAKDQLDKLPESILAKAFRGELVTKKENDESAGALLKRIQSFKTRKGKA